MSNKFGVSVKWLSVACFEIRCDGLTVVSDPYVTDCVCTDLTWEAIENCDILCLTHAHYDHITDIPKLVEKFSPLLLCGEQTAMPMATWLNYNPSRIYPMYPDTELDFDKIKIRALYGRYTDLHKGFNDQCARLPAYRLDEGINKLRAVGSFEYRNYLFTFPSGTTVLLWGNDPTPEQKNICKALKPDIAIIQRSVSPGNIKEKAEFASAIGCKVLIPHHMDLHSPDSSETLETFREEFLRLVPDGIFINPAHGEWIDL